MATVTANKAEDNAAVVSPNRAGEVIAVRGAIILTAAQVVTGNIINLCKLPAGCEPVDLVVDFDDLDANASPTTTATFGLLNAAGDALAVAAGALTAVQLGAGGIERADDEAFFRADVDADDDRYVSVILGGTVATAAEGVLGCTLQYRAKD